MVDSIEEIKDFKGKSMDPEKFAYARSVQVTPTLQLVDESGEELVPKLIGYQGAEFFAAYLNNAIDGSKQILQQR